MCTVHVGDEVSDSYMMISVWSPTSSYTSTIILIEPMQIPHHHDHLGGYIP